MSAQSNGEGPGTETQDAEALFDRVRSAAQKRNMAVNCLLGEAANGRIEVFVMATWGSLENGRVAQICEPRDLARLLSMGVDAAVSEIDREVLFRLETFVLTIDSSSKAARI